MRSSHGSQGRQPLPGSTLRAPSPGSVPSSTGSAGSETKELVFKTTLAQSGTGDPSIAHDWAFQKVYHLIGEICRVGETPALTQELQALSQKYDIHTSYSP